MSERRITRRRGEAIRITGPATIRVNRRVTLTIEAPPDARIDRLEAPRVSDISWSAEPAKRVKPNAPTSIAKRLSAEP